MADDLADAKILKKIARTRLPHRQIPHLEAGRCFGLHNPLRRGGKGGPISEKFSRNRENPHETLTPDVS
jgi:hypothetical protein